ncbi:MAG: hypothetical protein JSW39_16920 [Desulfobacterales bacterium]|nr:MAG: hypothetical protein JSW39_16920 [Desulfobacterales bacterium]
MSKILAICIWVVAISVPQISCAENRAIHFADIRPRLEAILADLSHDLDQFENLQNRMDDSARASENYDEQKNIFLSSVLAITTIAAICEYETDLMTLFIDLREENRQKFYEVRIESLETSVKQINNMHKQIQINYALSPPDFFETALVNQERRTILSSLELLNRSIELLKSVTRQ